MVITAWLLCDLVTLTAWEEATPRAVLEEMDIDGLNLYHVKSHLQKYRQGRYTVREWTETSKNGPQVPVEQKAQAVRRVHHAFMTNSDDFVFCYGPAICSRPRPKARREVQGSLYLQMQAQSAYQSLMRVRNSYLDTMIDNACQAFTDAYLEGGPPANNESYWGQDYRCVGTVDLIPTSYPDEFITPNACIPMEGIQYQTAGEQQPKGFQAPIAAPAVEGSFFSVQQSATGFHGVEGFPNHSGQESMIGWASDEEPLESYFDWNDDNPSAQLIIYS
ncbi:hypothetical protein Tsubulata_025383 [Turnera subulata]|uniref:HTH myb-type domain-containing protein n=1 Tax=Turnera subulata TaxID=218843 RepID=A0A9Q0JLK1_9ROSI|nr:hypothetical protein Tsubulata_025383 [Turnera subulata]